MLATESILILAILIEVRNVQALHFILNNVICMVILDPICVNLPAKWILLWLKIIKIMSIPHVEYYSETAIGCTTSYMMSLLVLPLPLCEQVSCFICGCRRLTVTCVTPDRMIFIFLVFNVESNAHAGYDENFALVHYLARKESSS